MNNRNILNFSVRDRAGDTLLDTGFPRLAAQRVIRRTQIVRLDADARDRRDRAAAIVAAMERDIHGRQSSRIRGGFLPAPPNHRGVWPFGVAK